VRQDILFRAAFNLFDEPVCCTILSWRRCAASPVSATIRVIWARGSTCRAGSNLY